MAPKLNIPGESPDEARSIGPANANESVSAIERSGVSRSELSDGPKLGPTGNYEPAKYKLPDVTVTTPQGPVTIRGAIAEDF